MTTKDHCLPFKGKHVRSGIGTSPGCYGNLNLNQSHRCLSLESVHSKDFSIKSKKVQNYEKSISKDRKDSSNNKNASTLSLHIAAYENSIEAASDSIERINMSKDESNLIKTLENLKHMTLSPAINNPFEFPRQQTDYTPTDPAIMQFLASQRLFNPNQGNGDSVTTNINNSDMDEKRCFMHISINGKDQGDIVFKLYNDIVPRTCLNFMQLCEGSDKLGAVTGKKLTYQNSTFHRVVKGFMIQGGDFSQGDGTGGESVYGGTFVDENFIIKHDKPFILSMANRGENTNGSQFFITTSPTPSLDGKHVAFGEVVGGQNIVRAIENLSVSSSKSRPLADVVITKCGILTLRKKEKSSKKVRPESEEEVDAKRSKKRKSKKEEDEIYCSIKAEDIPKDPPSSFLSRRSPPRDFKGKERYRHSRHSSSQNRRYDSEGRRLKGRGVPRYDPRNSNRALPDWEREERRKIRQKDATEIIAQKRKEAEGGSKKDSRAREKSSSLSSRENSVEPPPKDLKSLRSERRNFDDMEVDFSSTVAEHIRNSFSSVKREPISPKSKRQRRNESQGEENQRMPFEMNLSSTYNQIRPAGPDSPVRPPREPQNTSPVPRSESPRIENRHKIRRPFSYTDSSKISDEYVEVAMETEMTEKSSSKFSSKQFATSSTSRTPPVRDRILDDGDRKTPKNIRDQRQPSSRHGDRYRRQPRLRSPLLSSRSRSPSPFHGGR